MGRNRVSNDVDFVQPDQYVIPPNRKAKQPPPDPKPLPHFEPLHIESPYIGGAPNLPPDVNPTDPYALFRLIFTEELLKELVAHTNEYAKLHPIKKKNAIKIRPWTNTTTTELLAYFAVIIHMGIHIEPDIADYWKQTRRQGTKHFLVYEHISLVRFQQLDRMLHILKPKPTDDPRKEDPFDKVATLSEHVRQRFRLFWKPGTHLAVDEMITRFTGRAFEPVNIPSKPTPEGFKIWALANEGYILDWLFHAKGDKKGPIDLDTYWTKEEHFSKTQAVVLDLLMQEDEVTGQRYIQPNKHIVWLDNLFISVKLLSRLRDEGIGVAGTVRTTKTRREVIDEDFSPTVGPRKYTPKSTLLSRSTTRWRSLN